jgi:hypothetical protein
MNYYDTYGKITLLKGTKLYHWSNTPLTNTYNNLFLCLDNSFWKDTNKIMHIYKLIRDINLIVTIQNEHIIKTLTYSSNKKKYDYEILTTIFNDTLNTNLYDKNQDVSLKPNQSYFNNFCRELSVNNYEGLFNYIDSEKGMFEIVIFEPTNYLKLIENKKYENVKLHTLSDCKRIMLSKKINYTYPYVYNYNDVNNKVKEYPSIFYYIYKKTNTSLTF